MHIVQIMFNVVHLLFH